MKHVFRFIGSKITPDSWIIDDPEEMFHLEKVIKLSLGDLVEITNGKGETAEGKLIGLTKKSASIKISSSQIHASPQVRLGIGFGAPKPSTVDDLLPPLVELGIDEILIFQQDHTAKRRLGEVKNSRLSRWDKIIRTSVKQSKRAFIPKLLLFNDLSELLNSTSNRYPCRIVLDETSECSFNDLRVTNDNILVLSGSECGFSETEKTSILKFGFLPRKLTATILTAKTAIIAATAILSTKRTC